MTIEIDTGSKREERPDPRSYYRTTARPEQCRHETERYFFDMRGFGCADCRAFLREATHAEQQAAWDEAQPPEPGPLERRLIHQPRQSWSPGTAYRCTHRVKDQDATILVRGFKRGDYRQCTVCGAEVAA